MLINKFLHCNKDVKHKLFKTYICKFYMSQLWCKQTQYVVNKFRVAYNNIFKLDRRCSVSHEQIKRSDPTIEMIIRSHMSGILKRVYRSENIILNDLLNSDVSIKTFQTLI